MEPNSCVKDVKCFDKRPNDSCEVFVLFTIKFAVLMFIAKHPRQVNFALIPREFMLSFLNTEFSSVSSLTAF